METHYHKKMIVSRAKKAVRKRLFAGANDISAFVFDQNFKILPERKKRLSYPDRWLIYPGADLVIISLLLLPVALSFDLASRIVSLGVDGDPQKLKFRFAAHCVEPPRGI